MNFFRQKYEPIKLLKIFNYKNIKCTCTSFENKMTAENTMFLQESMNNGMLQPLLVASQQQQHFDTQQFQGMYIQQNTQQNELQKNLITKIKKVIKNIIVKVMKKRFVKYFLLDVKCISGAFCKTNENENSSLFSLHEKKIRKSVVIHASVVMWFSV